MLLGTNPPAAVSRVQGFRATMQQPDIPGDQLQARSRVHADASAAQQSCVPAPCMHLRDAAPAPARPQALLDAPSPAFDLLCVEDLLPSTTQQAYEAAGG